MKIGLRLESLGLPLRRALAEAARIGVLGVQFDAVGDLAPNQLSETGRRELRNLLRTYNVELTALGCPMRRGLDTAENLEARIDHVRQVLTLSFELGPRLVVVQAGKIVEDDKAPAATLLHESLLALGHYGDRVGSILALETGLEDAAVLAGYLDRLDTGSLAVNYDPANLLINGFDPYTAVKVLHQRIAHAHAKDARKSSASRTAAEVPLGHGDLDWMRLSGELQEIEYRGWLMAERESGDRSPADMESAVKFLRRVAGG
ncbi:MAG: sugar phosphate isomerase/epimerase [Gemmataceae bacterium]|nr:sugar phosphate isomerase/epimerase [Gemmataceae bacterium]